MRNKIIFFIILLILIFINAGLNAQNAIKVNAKSSYKPKVSYPVRTNNDRYIENNQPKKKVKTEIKMINSDSCPSFAAYVSKPKQKREKTLSKNR